MIFIMQLKDLDKFQIVKKTLKHYFIYIAPLLSLSLNGQIPFSNDTIKIQEVIISSKKTSSGSTGYKVTSLDSSVLGLNSHSSIAELLAENTSICIKSYGMGGTASPSFRGTGASHTQLSWNSININHPMLGQADLALVPSGLVDDVQIYYGGASMKLNSGGIGGIINLDTKPVWKKETVVSINPGVGSFGQYTGLVKIKSGNSRFQTVTKAFYQSSDNDYRYLNTEISSEPVWQTRINSQVHQQGFLQEFYYRKSNNVASARIWYESAQRNLPSSMLTVQPNLRETQADESLRTLLNYDISGKKANYSFSGAWMTGSLNYFNSLASIDSRNLSETMTLKSVIDSKINKYTNLKIIVNEELNLVKSNNYSRETKRNTATVTAIAERNGCGRLGYMVLLRGITDNKKLLLPDFSTGIQFRIIDGREYYLKANLSRNSKIPAMNDMFWVPGGNPDLKNEYAFIYEVDYEMNQKISSMVNLHYDLSLYHNNIKDMIQWHPGEYSYWTADNIKSVNSSGAETSLSLNYTVNKLAASLKAGYSYTRAVTVASNTLNDHTIGKQLMYVPENQANCSFRMNYKMVYYSWLITMTGIRYTSVDNSEYLPGYMLNNIIAGIKLNMKSNSIDVNFRIDNLFDVNYQTIAYYPLPGRSYSLKLLFQLQK